MRIYITLLHAHAYVEYYIYIVRNSPYPIQNTCVSTVFNLNIYIQLKIQNIYKKIVHAL